MYNKYTNGHKNTQIYISTAYISLLARHSHISNTLTGIVAFWLDIRSLCTCNLLLINHLATSQISKTDTIMTHNTGDTWLTWHTTNIMSQATSVK